MSKKGGASTFFIFRGGLTIKGWGQIFRGGAATLEDTMVLKNISFGVIIPGLEIMDKNYCEGDIFEHNFRL